MVSGMQRRVELSVTDGIGYDSQTDFSKSFSCYADYFNEDDIKNTSEGLNAHLRELSCPEGVRYGRDVGFLFSSNGRRMDLIKFSRLGKFLNSYRNNRAVDVAYNVEAKRVGKMEIILCGVVKKILGKGAFDIVNMNLVNLDS